MPLSILFAVQVIVSAEAPIEPPWKPARVIDGLKVETREVRGSTFEEVKVSAVSARPLATLCEAVWGQNAKVEGQFKKRVVISETGTERWTYEQLRVPVLADRDCVMHAQLVAAASSGRCEVRFESGSDPSYPKVRDHVRVSAVRGHWVLEPMPDGKVDITYLVYSEPGGLIPAFLSRGGQRQAAVDFMKLILARADE